MKDLVVALSGGVGGAKLALGLSRILSPEMLTVAVNTGDDFDHLGLRICPDIDTILYTLAGVENPATGWGRRDETWNFMNALGVLGGASWFRLGDSDLATHVERTRRLNAGEPLSQITADFARRYGISARILPMSNDNVRTKIRTSTGWLDFQNYFVERQCEPEVIELAYEGADAAKPNPDFLAALSEPRLRAVVICPSNPFISIDPILAVPGVRDALRRCPAPVVAVAPIINGKAVKGPTAKMMRELGLEVSAASVAKHYEEFLDAYVLDVSDRAATDIKAEVAFAPSLMVTLQDREILAKATLDLADKLRANGDRRLAGA